MLLPNLCSNGSSYASAVGECGSNNTIVKQKAVPAPTPLNSNPERKYNIVVYGVDECASRLTRASRQEADLESVVSLYSRIDSSITSQCIRDSFRPRPLLVKLIRVTDMNKILSKSRLIPKPYMFKPDMSPSQHQCEAILLKERWGLVQGGISRKNIRIREECIFVNNKLNGRVTNNEFQANPAWQADISVSRAPLASLF